MTLSIKIKNQLEQWGPIDSKVLFVSFWFLPTADLAKKMTGIGWPRLWGVFKKDRLTFYWHNSEMASWGNLALEKWILPRSKRDQLWKKYFKIVRGLNLLNKKINADLNFNAARPLAKKYYQLIMDFWSVTLVPEIANFTAPDFLRQKLEGIIPQNKIDHALEILLAPEKLSFHQQNELELLKLVSGNRNDLNKKLEAFSKNWYWLGNTYYENKNLTASDFLVQAEKLSKTAQIQKIKQIQNYSSQVIQKKQSLKKQLKLPKEIMALSKTISFSIWWQDHRKAEAWKAHAILENLNKILEAKIGISEDQLMHYSAEEWLKAYTSLKLVPTEVLKKRKQFFVAEIKNQDYKFLYGKNAAVLSKKLAFTPKKIEKNILKGIVVSRGNKQKVKGRVKILLSPKQVNKLNKGDILVAPMTSPDFVPAMRQASAIITDVGGLMSHAAVVSREMNLPCIVGTKIATKMLKDGDLVEIYTTTGLVKILKPATI